MKEDIGDIHVKPLLNMSRTLIERAMAMRCLAYTSEVKHNLLLSTIMDMDKNRKGIRGKNIHLQEMEKVKNMFIANMSHEMGTPLTSIMGFTSIMINGLAGPLTDKQEEYLSHVEKAVNHLQSLLSDSMDIAKIESNRIDVEIQSFSISQLLDENITYMINGAEQKGLTIEKYIDEDIVLNTDKKRLTQCIINILTNSVKYTNEGSISIAVKKKDSDVEISVQDTGIGIAKKVINDIFEPFSRVKTVSTSKVKGSGIGLYLTKKLITNVLKGDLLVESELDKGSVFTMVIPQTLPH